MGLIQQLVNTASVTYDGVAIPSNPVTTDLLLPPLIVKTVNSLVAKVGDVLTYTVTITNPGLTTLTNLPFADTLPNGSTYVDSSFTLNGSSVTPTLEGSTVKYTIPSILGGGNAILQFQADVVGGTE